MNVTSLAEELGITKQCLFSHLWRFGHKTVKKGRDAILAQDQIIMIRRYYADKNIELSPQQLEITIGSLLGDGCLSDPPRGESRFIKTQCRQRRDYLEWHVKEFGLFSKPLCDGTKSAILCAGNKIITDKSRLLKHTQFYTKNDFIFTSLRNKWYKDGIKIIPVNVKLSPLILAVWYCDDGYNDILRKQVKICTNSFTFDEVELLAGKLKKMNLKFGINKVLSISGVRKPVLALSRPCYVDFIDIVKPYITCNSMQYKISLVNSFHIHSC